MAKKDVSKEVWSLLFQWFMGFCPSCASLNHCPAVPCRYPLTTWSLYSSVYWFILADRLNSSNHSMGSWFPPKKDGILASFLIRKAFWRPCIRAFASFSLVLILD